MNSKLVYGSLVFVILLLTACTSKNMQSVTPAPTRIAESIAVNITPTPAGFYADPDGYFTLQVPNGLDKATRSPDEKGVCKTTLMLADKNAGFSDDYTADIIIKVCKTDKKDFPGDALGDLKGEKEVTSIINAHTGFVKIGKGSFDKNGYEGDVRRYVFFENGVEYIIDWNIIPEHKNSENKLNEVLQSFKFK